MSRQFFGISYPETPSKIIYKAAVEESYPGEGEKLGCETFIIKKGQYISIYIKDFMKDIPKIGQSFQELLADERIDPNGCCVEEYINDKDVRCMVRLKGSSKKIDSMILTVCLNKTIVSFGNGPCANTSIQGVVCDNESFYLYQNENLS